MNYLPGLALNHDPPDLCLLSIARITGMNHQHLATILFFKKRKVK
jgi:hypothetical protein